MRLIGLVWGLQMVLGLRLLAVRRATSTGACSAGALFGLALMAVGCARLARRPPAAGRRQPATRVPRRRLGGASTRGSVDGLGGALRKIADQQARHVAAWQSSHAGEPGPPAGSPTAAPQPAGARWWHTHPPLAERLRRLYGREVLPLAAEMLPPIEEDDSDALMRIAPALPGSAGPADHAGPGDRTTDAEPEAHRHDALQRPSSFDAAARERRSLGAHRTLARSRN